MMWTRFLVGAAALAWMTDARAARILPDDAPDTMMIPVTPFANMASGYQATNPGFVAFLKDDGGKVVASGPMTMDAVINGYSDDGDRDSPYGRLVLSVGLAYTADDMNQGKGQHGRLSICMAADGDGHACKRLSGNIHEDRPFQWLDKEVDYDVEGGKVTITQYHGSTGEGGTSHQISLAVFHPAYSFAAPGKAFKDFQSPLVLDLEGNGKLDLTDVWSDTVNARFDMRGDGYRVRSGWTGPLTGFLALDFNGNGCIDDGAELFGEYTRLDAVSTYRGKTFADGFAALAALDANGDGVVDAKDPLFGKLRVWRNTANDGVCKPSELYTMEQLGIQSFSVAKAAPTPGPGPLMVAGNEVRLYGSYKTEDGKSHLMADVWFKQRPFFGMTEAEKRLASKGDFRPAPAPGRKSYSMDVSNRRKVDSVADFITARTYVSDHVYVTDNLKPGMQVLFSASYGIGGEAGQSRGVLVEKDGGLYYKQEENPTSQLLLPPGLPFDSDEAVSRWELRSYLDLINKVALANGMDSYDGKGGTYGRIGASLVDFDAGTAGRHLRYKDALELSLTRKNVDGGDAEVRMYYAKGYGPVALEFTEESEPSGTFKVYFGDAASAYSGK